MAPPRSPNRTQTTGARIVYADSESGASDDGLTIGAKLIRRKVRVAGGISDIAECGVAFEQFIEALRLLAPSEGLS